jgi:NCS1 family nucleobase:cation symporter-1
LAALEAMSKQGAGPTPGTAGAGEFERERIPEAARKGPGKFWGMYAGEHAAGTEFMIGPLFLLNGVSLQNIFLGLLVGNLLAVLSWRFLCAPIATGARYTLYYHLEKLAGPGLVKVYNLANGVLFCFLAGAMITVSATAVGIPFDMPMPAMTDVYPSTVSFVLVVFIVGLVISTVAALGYDTVAKFANVASPWMILVFLACGLVAFRQLDVSSWTNLKAVWQDSIIVAQGGSESSTMGFWTVVFFAWFCNAAMHIGMSDLSIFRFARKPAYGWASAAGMYVGHYMAWIAAAFMLAAQIKATGDATPLPGPMAAAATGLAGIVCVVVAGWTTANPTIYRAGLAFQAIVPSCSRLKVTFAAGILATLAGAFPALAFKLLGFVGLYGTILAPMGAVIFFDWHFIRKREAGALDAHQYPKPANPAVLAAWLIPVGAALYLMQARGVTTWFFPLPCWIACGLLYLALANRRPNRTPVKP